MTHDELLAELNDLDHSCSVVGKTVSALRAVVELHKPDESEFPDEWESCVECSGNGYAQMYPCPTIQVIEKELK
jgi:hypothetical protein